MFLSPRQGTKPDSWTSQMEVFFFQDSPSRSLPVVVFLMNIVDLAVKHECNPSNVIVSHGLSCLVLIPDGNEKICRSWDIAMYKRKGNCGGVWLIEWACGY